jgi:hypothetical protein
MSSQVAVGTRVSVFTTVGAALPLGRGKVHSVAEDGIHKIHLNWKLADGRAATMYAQADCLRVESSVTKIGTEVAVKAAQGAILVFGRVTGIRNPDMVKVELPWRLADGASPVLYTPSSSLVEKAVVDKIEAENKRKVQERLALKHAAQFKTRTRAVVLALDGSGRFFTHGSVARNRFRQKMCDIYLPWKLADGTPAKLCTPASNLRLPTGEESLQQAMDLNDKGGKVFSKKNFTTALQHYVDALEYVQQWIVRRRAQSDSLGDFFRLQQKLFGNIAWCMFKRGNNVKTIEFCTRVFAMFDDMPNGKLPNDVQIRSKYLYLRGQAHLANTTSTRHTQDARKDCEAGKLLDSPLLAKFEKLSKKISAHEQRQKERKAKFAKGLAFGVKKTSPTAASNTQKKEKILSKESHKSKKNRQKEWEFKKI